jgi:hypothetical protein
LAACRLAALVFRSALTSEQILRSGLSLPHWTKPSSTTPTSAVSVRGSIQAGRTCQGHAHHFARVGRASQGARFDDQGTLRRSDPVGRTWSVRFGPGTSPPAALTVLAASSWSRTMSISRERPEAFRCSSPFPKTLIGTPSARGSRSGSGDWRVPRRCRVPRRVFQRLLPERPTPERCVEAHYLQIT